MYRRGEAYRLRAYAEQATLTTVIHSLVRGDYFVSTNE